PLMKSIRIPLITKFAAGISIVVLIFGIFNALFLRNSVTYVLEYEFKKRGFFIARTVSEKALFFILSDDSAGLNSLVNEIKDIDPSIRYVLVSDTSDKIIAHTFPFDVPYRIQNLHQTDSDSSSISFRDLTNSKLNIRDFKVAIVGLQGANVRVGMIENEIISSVDRTVNRAWIMVGFFLLGGLLAALFFSYTIATPLKVLSNHSQLINIENIKEGIKTIEASSRNVAFKIRRIFNSNDEIDLLYQNILSMLERLKQTHETMNQLQQSLLQAEKLASIGTLTAGVAHEINNPLAGLKIGINRIAKNPENREQIEAYTTMMQDSLSRMEQVVQDLLTFSRVSPKYREATCACTLITKSVKLAKYRIRTSKLNIEFVAANCPHHIVVNSNQMEQVFLNLLVNSIDAIMEKTTLIPDFEGLIHIGVQQDATNAYFVFSDNGMGIQPTIMNKIFDPFFTTKKTGEGTGLGLAVTYQIVKDHGGDIKVESVYKEGTKITIVLPKTNE
ncbi:MAG TPA: hypothetical protein DCM62_02720, partial [Bacteroidales bacterium]|nr:hypothetical protein [Bacteroidales bacterium]